MKRHGWTLLFHDSLVWQLRNLRRASEQAERKNPQADRTNANTRLFRALTNLIRKPFPRIQAGMSIVRARR